MKPISKKEAETLLKSKAAILEWNTLGAKYILRIQLPYTDRVAANLDSSYRISYKTGLILDKNNSAVIK